MTIVFEALFLILVVLLVIAGTLAFTLPKQVIRTALSNCRRSDGTWSRKRAVTEIKEVTDISGGLLLALVASFVMTIGPLLLIHITIVPIPMVLDIFGAFDVNPVQWEAGIETGNLGDVGTQYEMWGQQRGYSEEKLRFWQEFLWRSWPVLLALAAVFTGLFYWFVSRFYLSAAAHYGRRIVKRCRYYQMHDARRSV